MLEEKVLNTQLRENIYTFLAGIFLKEPSISQFPQNAEALGNLLKDLQCKDEVGGGIPEDHGVFIEGLRQDYYDCFFVPMSGRYVPPYESALLNYRAGEHKPFGTLNSAEASHVAACYDAVGFKPQLLHIFEPLKEIQFPDHIGFELAFMALLCSAEQSAWHKDCPAEALKWRTFGFHFLTEHLSKWLDNFAGALQVRAYGYYAQAAQAAANWVRSDLAELEFNSGLGEADIH